VLVPTPTLDDCRAAADELGAVAGALSEAPSWATKVFIGVNLFFWHLSAFERNDNPLPDFIRLCRASTALLDGAAAQSQALELQLALEKPPETSETVLGDLYSAVYATMDDDEYFRGSADIMRRRLEANGITPEELFAGKVVLDAGCGAGKFTQAIASFGAKKVIGIDIGDGNIAFARAQAEKVPHGKVLSYGVGSILNIPLESASVDFVWCNSVAHLTGDQAGALREIGRVLKPGGQLFYYVNGRFGLFEILLKMLVRIMHGVPPLFVQHFLQCLGVGAGRISWIVACIFAPYEFLPRSQVEKLLCAAGFTDLKLLKRGIEIDYSEKISRGEPYADLKYGEGQLRYLARRAAS
jgi:SAM-dependent methyltransferase